MLAAKARAQTFSFAASAPLLRQHSKFFSHHPFATRDSIEAPLNVPLITVLRLLRLTICRV
jgi:hypothetical protein